MINDGYWRLELFFQRCIISFWCFINRFVFSPHNEHRISRGILYSAVIVRKMIEDDKGIHSTARQYKLSEPELIAMRYRIPVWQLPFIGESEIIGYRFVASNYDYSNAKNSQYDLNIICNKIIHSSLWAIVYEGKRVDSIAFSSDKEKTTEAYVVKIKDWLDMLKYISEEWA